MHAMNRRQKFICPYYTPQRLLHNNNYSCVMGPVSAKAYVNAVGLLWSHV